MSQARQVLDERKKELARKQAENDLLKRQMDAMGQKILALTDSLKLGQEGLVFCEELANNRRGAMKGKIEGVITEAVRLIYGDTYRVELSYSVKNNRSCLEIEMVRETPAGEVRRDMGGFGGGMADTISVPLRLMVLIGSKQTDKVCILDECWKHMDLDRVELVGKFLRLLSDKLGMQIIMCSHHDKIRDFADRTYEVSETGGLSKVEAF
jgi:DNA repair exonuclease SbcCD ATPase subunit